MAATEIAANESNVDTEVDATDVCDECLLDEFDTGNFPLHCPSRGSNVSQRVIREIEFDVAGQMRERDDRSEVEVMLGSDEVLHEVAKKPLAMEAVPQHTAEAVIPLAVGSTIAGLDVVSVPASPPALPPPALPPESLPDDVCERVRV